MQTELDNLKNTDVKDKERVNHLLTDILMLTISASYRFDTDFDLQIEKWFKEMDNNNS